MTCEPPLTEGTTNVTPLKTPVLLVVPVAGLVVSAFPSILKVTLELGAKPLPLMVMVSPITAVELDNLMLVTSVKVATAFPEPSRA
jgi:hypothetical protein